MSDQLATDVDKTVDQPSYLEELVGKGKKYSTLEELAKGTYNANLFIDQLKNENGELRQDLETRMTLEDLLKQKDDESNTNNNEANTTPAVNPAEDVTPKEVGSEESDLDAKIREVLNQESTRKTAESNLENVANRLVEAFGDEDSARTSVAAKAKELGVSTEFLMSTAAQSPSAFLQMIGVSDSASQPKSASGKTKSDINSDGLAASNPNPKGSMNTFADYAAIRKEDPARYFSAAFQNEMFQKAKDLGDAFYKN